MELMSLLRSIITMAVACFIGILLANLILEFGFMKFISKPLAPLMKLANLPKVFSIPAIISMVDIRGGLSIIGSLREKNGIDNSTIIAYNLVARPFSIIFFLFRFYLPISITALGFFLGSIYTALSFISAFICMIIGIVYGRMRIKKVELEVEVPRNLRNKNDVLKSSLKSAINMTKKVILRYAIVTSVIAFLIYIGFFEVISESMDIHIRQLGLSSNSAALISIHIFSPTSSVLAAGEFLRNGLISAKECLIALLIGRLLFIVIMDYPRHSLSLYISIFPPKLAFKLVLTGIIVNIITTPILIAFVILF